MPGYATIHATLDCKNGYELPNLTRTDEAWMVLFTAASVLVVLGVLILIFRRLGLLPHCVSRLVSDQTMLPPSFLKLPEFLDDALLNMWSSLKNFSFIEFSVIMFLLTAGYLYFIRLYDSWNKNLAQTWGWTCLVILSLVVVPITKHSILLYIFNVPFERAVRYHRLLSRMFLLVQLCHLNFVIDHVGSFRDVLEDSQGYTGACAFLTTILIGFTAVEPIRRRLWELFYFSHVVLVPIVYVFTILHTYHKKNALIVLVVPLSVYVLDVVLRQILMLHRRCSGSCVATLEDLNGLATKITIRTALPCGGFNAGQYFWINVRSVLLCLWLA